MSNIHNNNIVNSNLIQGDNIQVNIGISQEMKSESNKSNKLILINTIRNLIAKDKIEESIEKMLEYFNSIKNIELLNLVINISSKLTALKMQMNFAILHHEQIKIDKAQINKTLLDIITDMENECL